MIKRFDGKAAFVSGAQKMDAVELNSGLAFKRLREARSRPIKKGVDFSSKSLENGIF